MLGTNKASALGKGLTTTALFLALGCQSSPSSPPPAKLAVGANHESAPSVERSQPKDVAQFIGEVLEELNKRQLSPERLTPAFKRKVAPAAKAGQDGYDPARVAQYLNKTVEGSFSDTFTTIEVTNGSWILGTVSNAGVTEGFLLHIIPVRGAEGWQIDWFSRSKVFLAHVKDRLGPDQAGAEMTVHCLMNNLLGGDINLAAATLSRAWKTREYPSSTPSNVEFGYEPKLVVQRLRGWKEGCADYSIANDREITPGKVMRFEVVAVDAIKGAPNVNLKRTFSLTVVRNPDGEWVVDDVETKSPTG